jgi:hypothetical protein
MPEDPLAEAAGQDEASGAMSRQGSDDDLVTIVVSFRERWRFTARVIDAIIDNTTGPFRIVLLDSGMPQNVRDEVRAHHESGAIDIVDVGPGTLPNHGRAIIAPRLKSKYVVFIDNDVIVMPHWLDRLVDCAESTGAGIVGPLYLMGNDGAADLVHMAGGDLAVTQEEGGLRMADTHRHSMRKLVEIEPELRREICDFAEYHCLMMRREVYSAADMFDRDIVTVHEHIHASLLARAMGYETWLEPGSKVKYLSFAPWLTGEFADFRHRWALATADDSLTHFASRWGVVDDAEFRDRIGKFLLHHFSRADLLDPRAGMALTRDRPMTRADLQQNFSGLVLLAQARGCTADEILLLGRCYRIALRLCNGMFRPCGRPFINHLVGLASVLLFYGCTVQTAVAGMLHAAFSHGRQPRTAEADGEISRLIGQLGHPGNRAANVAQLYDRRDSIFSEVENKGARSSGLPIGVAELYLLEAANDVDMHLSLEVATSGRDDALSGQTLIFCQEVMETIGLPALAATMSAAREEQVDLPMIRFNGEFTGSFLLDGSRVMPAARQSQN